MTMWLLLCDTCHKAYQIIGSQSCHEPNFEAGHATNKSPK